MGMDYRNDIHPMCCDGNGYVTFSHCRNLLADCCTAELCSSMPTSGGLYYASAVLAPPGYGPLAAWITGWANWFTQITGAPSVDYALASMILAAASITHPDYVPQNYQVWMLTVFILIIHACISSMPTKFIAQFNSVGSTLNIIALGVVIIMIPAGTNRTEQGYPRFTSSKEVWGTISNGTAFPPGISILMSFVAVIWTMVSHPSYILISTYMFIHSNSYVRISH
jgi:amino acid transporter